MTDSLWLRVKVDSAWSPVCNVWVKTVLMGKPFRNLKSSLQDKQFSEKKVEKVSIEDNEHRHELQLDVSKKFTGHPGLFRDWLIVNSSNRKSKKIIGLQLRTACI